MHHHGPVVGEYPLAVVESFHMVGQDSLFFELQQYGICDGLHPDDGIAAANDEKIGDAGEFAQVQENDLVGLLVVSNLSCLLGRV